jgi:type IV pilus assembly protein PilM
MDEADIRNAIQFKIEENAPVALSSAVFDYKLIRDPDPKATTMEVGVTVIHTKVVSSYISVLYDAGLVPLEMRTEAQAIARAIIAPEDKETCIIIGVRETKTVLAIISKGVVQFTSTLPIGGKSLAESIKKNFDVNDSEVQKIRSGKVVRENNEMFLSLVNAASVLRDEIQKLFTYWDGHADVSEGMPIKHILLSGADTMLGLETYLGRSFSVPVMIADPWKNIVSVGKYVPPITKREALDYIPALGLALPYD